MSNDVTFFERQKLQYLLRTKLSIRAIAKIMRRNHTILIREIERNGGSREKYRSDTAQRQYEKRKHKKHIGKLQKHNDLRKYVEEKISHDWSPEQIAGRLKECPPRNIQGLTISHESIYYWIYEKSEKYKKLHKHLRTHRNKRKGHGKRKSKKVLIPQRISIHERSEIVDEKDRFGDWETDTVEFTRKKKNPYLSVQYERKSQIVRMHTIKNKSAEETKEAIIKTGESVSPTMFHTITFDNGSEGVRHHELKEYYLNLETYFCDPYCSWQKGGVENANKLIRQYLPRDTDFQLLTDNDIHTIQEKLNNRPRKGLNYLTPNEVIKKVVL